MKKTSNVDANLILLKKKKNPTKITYSTKKFTEN